MHTKSVSMISMLSCFIWEFGGDYR